jgi:hypothetical protein
MNSKGITSFQRAQINMYNVVEQLLNGNTTITAAIAQIATVLAGFSGNVAEIATMLAKVAEDITGNRKATQVLKAALAKEAYGIEAAMYAYAQSLTPPDTDLASKTRFANSYFAQARDAQIADRAQVVHDLAVALVTVTPPATNPLIPFGVTAARVTAFQTQITDYVAAVPNARSAIAGRKADNLVLRTLIASTGAILNDQMDQLIIQLEPANPEFYTNYLTARKLVDPRTLHTRITGTITDAVTGNPIDPVLTNVSAVSSTGTTYTGTANDDGYTVYTPKFKKVSYTLKIQHPGYNDVQTAGLTVRLGKATTVNIQMTPTA